MLVHIVPVAILLIAIGSLGSRTVQASPRLLPPPLEVRGSQGRFELPDTLTISWLGTEEADRFPAEMLARELAAWGHSRVGIAQVRDAEIQLGLRSTRKDLGEEGYELSVSRTGIVVRAAGPAGVFHGVQTLRQLIEPAGLPAVEIIDRPSLSWRGVLEDLSRGPVPTVEAMERRIEMLAELKLNLYAIYLENGIEYPGHDLAARREGSLTLAELEHLGDYAIRHHMTLVPVQQTLGHMGAWLDHDRYRTLAMAPGSQTLDPEAPLTDAFLAPLLRQLAAHTPGSFVHIGADEADVTSGRVETSAPAMSGETLVRFIRRQHDVLAESGKRTIVWGDGLLTSNAPISTLPENVLIATWKYELADDYSPQIEPFRKAKRDFIVCPGAWNWRRMFPDINASLSNIRRFTHQGRAAGALGQITCTWGDGGEALFPLTWYSVAAGAMASWSPAVLDTAELHRTFDWWWLRADGSNAADAIAHLGNANPIFWRGTQLLAEPLFTWLDPIHPVNRGVLARLAGVAPELEREMEAAMASIGMARSRASRRREQLEPLEFASRRILGVAECALGAQQARIWYLDAQRASQPGGDPKLAASRIESLRGIYARQFESLVDTRDAFARVWDSEHMPAGRSRVTAQYDRSIARAIDRLELFRMLRLLLVNGRGLPPAQEVGFDP